MTDINKDFSTNLIVRSYEAGARCISKIWMNRILIFVTEMMPVQCVVQVMFLKKEAVFCSI